jgi:DNA-binding transcriptional MocR family regulator
VPATINKADQAYDKLERMITFQELAPGSMVSEGTLMELTGLGRSPVRDALQRLAWEGTAESLGVRCWQGMTGRVFDRLGIKDGVGFAPGGDRGRGVEPKRRRDGDRPSR